MAIIVVGAGVVGLSTAYALHSDGQDVAVVDRLSGPGLGTSFANAGGLCPSFAGPWAAPGMIGKAVRWLAQPSAPLKIRPRLDPAQWRWLWQFAQACKPSPFEANKRAMQAIAHYSHACLREIVEETGLRFDRGEGGILQTFRSPDSLAGGRRAAEVLSEMGIAHRLLDPEEIAQIEPALARTDLSFTGALHFPDDGTGDAQAYCRAMAAWLEDRGVSFRYGTEITGLRQANGRLTGLRTPDGEIAADAVVLAGGPWIPALVPEIPVYPVKGYSLTWPGIAEGAGPRSSIMDEDSKIMFTRLGDRLRVGGMAELDGFSTRLPKAQLAGMTDITHRFFPEAAASAPEPWTGHRPMTPDGRPRIGPSARVEGLWINAGHGSNGWTQAAGAGRLMADLIAGHAPAIDPAPYRPVG
ncbi:D-amino acid dehydrogenase [Jannaschia seohaensis]|uniref:D-amino-acid dehydrogenase n=1 Tax=Jannaschia seohaensis TaxID=475081 RepID=A0A2Y9C3H1_9RHOB|nr:D-amino acid dehydrogenase [Jannaschia seohaensis]PWJ11161.1 D-amino-acid dehydrogenase [Jannaschia seohaensis]SSA51462.1 D-amino-acid dehydrogenase [Jannaschia seohaensis]